MEGKGENGIVEGSSDCEDERAKLRPADIDADVREMERRKRVEAMMSSRLFREELERIVEAQMKDGAAAVGPLLQQIQDMIQTGPARAHNSFSVKSTNCVIPINDIRGVESMGYAKGEKILRCKLAAIYRLMDLYGWAQGISNHITGRLNQEEELLLVNAFGMLYHEVTASSLVKVDMQGNIVEPGTTNYGVNVQGFHLHAAIHQARPDIKCIIHVHTPSVLAVSSLKVGLLPLSNESVVIGEVSSHQSSGSIQEPEEKDKLARNLGPINKVMLLSNNGAVCCGETVEEAFFNVYNTVLACESQMKVVPLGIENLVLMQDEARKAIYDGAHKVPESTALPSTTGQPTENKEKRWRIGGLHFEALMRMLDNAGFRTGYIYRTPLIKGEPPKPRSDVEVPPAVSSLGYLLEEEEMYRNWKKMGATKSDRSRWLNSPNVYQKVEILETGTPDPKKITKWVDANAEEWVADGSPTHSSTPVKISDMLQFVPKNTNPKEFKKLQQQIKENRRADKITSGPQSHILEGVSWEDAKKLQDANLMGAGDQVVLVGAASKGIIQREFQHNATVYKTPYTKNPFDSISAQEIEDYKRTVTRKQRGESYDEEQSESEALSSSAALPPSGFKSPPSETDEDSRTEPRVLRIETKTAPIPSQAEFVLSDDGPRKLKTAERIRCYTRYSLTPSPACKERPVIVNMTSIKKSPKVSKYLSENNCLFCQRSLTLKKNCSFNADLSNRSTQTVMSISEISDDNMCHVSKLKRVNHKLPQSNTPIAGGKKRPVVRKLAMDSVIDELKDKISEKKFTNLGIYNLEEKNEKSSDEELTSCTLYRLPNVNGQIQNLSENDFTSEGTTTRTSSSLADDSPKEKPPRVSDGMESYIGNDFEGWESMCEKHTPPSKLPENLDSYTLSDLLSNCHISDDKDILSNSNLFISHHTNSIKKAVLMKNHIPKDDVIDYGYTVLFKIDKSLNNMILNIDFTDTGHLTSCGEESQFEETNFICDDGNSYKDDESTIAYVSSESHGNGELINEEEPDKNEKLNEKDSEENVFYANDLPKGEANNISSSECNQSPRISLRSNPLNLTINGKDLYNFYNEFDPNEVFQKDSDNGSTRAHYDNQSLVECCIENEAQTIFEEDSIKMTIPNTPVVVNENIFMGKKYLMTRYLSGNSNGDNIEENVDKSVFDEDNCLLDSSDESSESLSGKDNNCGNSEDSAVFSELTVKTTLNPTNIIDPDKIIEWSLSDNSKGGLSMDSSGSSGIRMSSASEEDVPERPIISSIDEFLIKESVCNICPEMDRNSLCNSCRSYPTGFSYGCFDTIEVLKKASSLPNLFNCDYSSLLCNWKHRLIYTSYELPSKSKICSYYTLVSGLDKYSSLPDLTALQKGSSSSSNKSMQTNSASDDLNKELAECEFDDHDVYIFDDFISLDSGSDFSASSNVLHFLNDSNNANGLLDSNLNYDPKSNSNSVQSNISNNERISPGFTENDCNSDCNPVLIDGSEILQYDDENSFFVENENSGLSILNTEWYSSSINNCPDSNDRASSFKDCLKCFAISLEESIDNLVSSETRRNTIISSLKRKFSRHKCNSYNLKMPVKSKLSRKSKSIYRRHHNTGIQSFKINKNYSDPELYSFNSLSDVSFIDVDKNNYHMGEPFDRSTLYYSCISDSNDCETNKTFNGCETYKTLDGQNHSFVDMDLDENKSMDNNQEFVSREENPDQFFFSTRSESFISLPSSSISSETETFYSFGVFEPKTSRSNCSNTCLDNECKSAKHEFVLESSFENVNDLTCIDHNRAFCYENNENPYNLSDEEDRSDEDMENYLHEIAINVSSVSCQTDESMQDEDSSEYRAEDYTEDSDPPNYSSEPDISISRQAFVPPSHQLYTIFETSCELSPEY